MRYIDADAAVEEARLAYCKDCNSYNGVMCRACAFDDAMSFIEDYPAADVVPNAGVEMLKKIILTNVEATEFEVKEAKARLAREIFEDLEMYVEEHNGCSVNLSRCEFAELKEKYTEGETNVNKAGTEI
jgi:hypothetical protein